MYVAIDFSDQMEFAIKPFIAVGIKMNTFYGSFHNSFLEVGKNIGCFLKSGKASRNLSSLLYLFTGL